MSWTDVFPVLTDEMVDLFAEQSTEEEKRKFEKWFAVDEIFNPSANYKHLVSTSLFWKREYLVEGELPAFDRSTMIRAERLKAVSDG